MFGQHVQSPAEAFCEGPELTTLKLFCSSRVLNAIARRTGITLLSSKEVQGFRYTVLFSDPALPLLSQLPVWAYLTDKALLYIEPKYS